MRYDEFVARVQELGSIEEREATERVTKVTLGQLARLLEPGEAQNLASQLPDGLKRPVLDAADDQAEMKLDDFFEEVRKASGADMYTVGERRARAVIEVLGESITRGEIQDVFNQLPGEFLELFPAKQHGQ